MCLHDLELFRGERARLLQNVILDADLAHIMQLGRDAQNFEELVVQPHLAGNL